jgi:hypothetical protein
VVHDCDVLVEAVPDLALADHGQVRVLVVRPRGQVEEELGREVVDVLGREHLRRPAVHRQPPAREEAGVTVEETVRRIGPGIDVAAAVADDEGRAVEDADGVAGGHWFSF